jgi:hypothetical protein
VEALTPGQLTHPVFHLFFAFIAFFCGHSKCLFWVKNRAFLKAGFSPSRIHRRLLRKRGHGAMVDSEAIQPRAINADAAREVVPTARRFG